MEGVKVQRVLGEGNHYGNDTHCGTQDPPQQAVHGCQFLLNLTGRGNLSYFYVFFVAQEAAQGHKQTKEKNKSQ